MYQTLGKIELEYQTLSFVGRKYMPDLASNYLNITNNYNFLKKTVYYIIPNELMNIF